MDSKASKLAMTPLRAKSSYERFLISEGVPMVGGFGVNAVRDLPMAPWRRLGCDGAYFQLSRLGWIHRHLRRQDRAPADATRRNAICTKKSFISFKAKALRNFSNAVACRSRLSGGPESVFSAFEQRIA